MDASLLKTITDTGVILRADGDTLRATGRLTPEYRQLIRQHKAELLAQLKAANDPGPVFRRWRLTSPDGRIFDVSCYPPATRGELLAKEPEGTQAEPITPPTGGTLSPEGEAIIRAVLKTWEATPDEIRDAIAEAASNPALVDAWRWEAEGLGLSVDRIRENGDFSTPAPPAPAQVEAGSVDTDDRITCRECARLRHSGLCGSPTWGPRYRPPPLPHRCAEFLPRAGDPDQRTGRERWPTIKESRI